MKKPIPILSLVIIILLGWNRLKSLTHAAPGSALVQNVTTKATDQSGTNDQFDEINPISGYSLGIKYGHLGPLMLASGVIDLNKFRDGLSRSGQSLTSEEESILTQGSDEDVVITRDNSYFLLNFFWAVGLVNKSHILIDGEMIKYGGKNDLGNFASTGGWTLSQGDAMHYLAASRLISLTPQQEDLVIRVAGNIYRPCCNNSTAFPDCNHGMALLGLLELMAASNVPETDMYTAAKYINAYWFPKNYYDLAVYFKNKEGKKFSDIDSRLLLSKEYSSATGYQNVKSWLTEKGFLQEDPGQNRGCGG